jgi:hypothetical protein
MNVLLQKFGAGNDSGINLSFMPLTVTAIARRPPHIVAECCSFVSLAFSSRARDSGDVIAPALAGSGRREEDCAAP